MIAQDIENIIASVLHWAYVNTFGHLDPFWGYFFEFAGIIAACVLIGWFFTIARPIAGAIAMACIAFLVGFWKGEDTHKRKTKENEQ